MLAVALSQPSDDIDLPNGAAAARLDRWLWAVRMFKTRPLATEACRRGNVSIADQAAKPGREVHPGDVVVLRLGLMTRTLRVVAVPRSRVGAKLVAQHCVDLTPPEEFEKAKQHQMQQFLARERGAGRPTKRDRREIDRFFG